MVATNTPIATAPVITAVIMTPLFLLVFLLIKQNVETLPQLMLLLAV